MNSLFDSKQLVSIKRLSLFSFIFLIVMTLLGCGSNKAAPKPVEFSAQSASLPVRSIWTAQVGSVAPTTALMARDATISVVNAQGLVQQLNAQNGKLLWKYPLKASSSVTLGSDGNVWAVVTQTNELIILDTNASGEIKELWKQTLPAQTFTAPLVAGRRVFVLMGDRSVIAFDAQSGRKLWTQQRPTDPLILQQAGVLQPVGNTLIAGLAGRMTGLDPSNGTIRWEASIATPRGTNDVERLVDLVSGVNRVDSSLCARSFQAAIGCVDTERGVLAWTKSANGATGLTGDAETLFGTESNGRLVAWRRSNGERLWINDLLQLRRLTAPVLLGKSIAVADDEGFVYLLSRENGRLLNRLETDGSAITSAPLLLNQTLLVLTKKGGVFAFQPD